MASNPQPNGERSRRDFVAAQKRWLVEDGDVIGKLAGGNRDWASQARGIWEAARHESEPLVILNLLRYQAARNDTSWKGVAGPLENAIERCQTTAREAGDEGLAMDLIRHLLVYTIRSHKFHSWQQSRERRQGRDER